MYTPDRVGVAKKCDSYLCLSDTLQTYSFNIVTTRPSPINGDRSSLCANNTQTIVNNNFVIMIRFFTNQPNTSTRNRKEKEIAVVQKHQATPKPKRSKTLRYHTKKLKSSPKSAAYYLKEYLKEHPISRHSQLTKELALTKPFKMSRPKRVSYYRNRYLAAVSAQDDIPLPKRRFQSQLDHIQEEDPAQVLLETFDEHLEFATEWPEYGQAYHNSSLYCC